MRNKAQLNVVVATAANTRGIGKNGGLPWRLAKDMQYFKQLTCTTNSPGKQNAVVMGRKTWESIPAKFRPLTGRVNVVVSSTLASQEIDSSSNDVVFVSTFDDALEQLGQNELVENVFVIGGAGMYAEAMRRPECQNVFLTQVYGDFDCDVFFPEMPADSFRCAGTPDFAPGGRQKEGEVEYEFLLYKRCESTTKKEKKELDPTECAGSPVHAESSSSSFASGFPSPRTAPRHEEHQYLDMIKYILEHGNDRGDRTGTGTLSTFGTTMRFSLRDDTFPLLTTKRVFWRGVAEELLWFISGDTSAKTLQEKNIHIWDGNGSREYLDKIGLSHREEGDLGPVYGFQWRHFGAKYKTMHDDYTGEGVDQLAQLIHTIKTNPTDRRMIISAWNPAAFHEMALPPCHMFAQFYVSNGELSCQMYQRSADMGLGVPFNIASYALLTRILAHCTDLKAGEFVHVMGDCHVYKDHVEPLREQLEREPFPFPKLKINTTNKDIDGFSFEDFEVVDYKCHKPIKMRMSV